MIEFTVPGQPFSKQRPRAMIAGKGDTAHIREYTPIETVNYETLVKLAFMAKYPGHTPWDYDTPVRATIKCFFIPPKGKRARGHCCTKQDADNCAKSVLDALNQIAYADDRQVADLHVTKEWSEQPRVFISMEELI